MKDGDRQGMDQQKKEKERISFWSQKKNEGILNKGANIVGKDKH